MNDTLLQLIGQNTIVREKLSHDSV